MSIHLFILLYNHVYRRQWLITSIDDNGYSKPIAYYITEEKYVKISKHLLLQ